MTQEEREAYDDAQRRLADSAETQEAQQRMFARTSDGQSTYSSPCDDARQEWIIRDPVERTTD